MSPDTAITINVKEFTDNVTTVDTGTDGVAELIVNGTGIFDELMKTATSHLLAQYHSNRIRNEDYATLYGQIYQTTLQACLQMWLQKGIAEKQLEMLAKQAELLEKQMETEDAKSNLYRRQIEGFDEDYKQKILKICLDSWAVAYSVAKDSLEAQGYPVAMTKANLDTLLNQWVLPDLDQYTYGRPGI